MKFYLALMGLLLCAMLVIPLAVVGVPSDTQGTGSSSSIHAQDVYDAMQQQSSSDSSKSSTVENSSAPEAQEAIGVYTGVSMSDSIKVLDEATGQLLILSQREYVIGATAAEMPPSFHTEAIKAQAVAAHTYALYNMLAQRESPNPDLQGAYFTVNTEKREGYVSKAELQIMYGDNFNTYYAKLETAVDEVLSMVIVYQNEPIVAAYHAISAGETEDASNVWGAYLPYLVPVESQGDLLAPEYEVSTTLSAQTVSELLETEYPACDFSGPEEDWLVITEVTGAGYIIAVEAGGVEVTGRELRSILALRSTCLAITYGGGSFTFTQHGYGHGVGLSQYGADYMGRQGSSYQEILSHYYEGTKLAQID